MISNKTLLYSIFVLIRILMALFNYVNAEQESSQKAGWQFPSISASYGSIEFPINFGRLSGFGSDSGSSGSPSSFPDFGGLSGLFGRPSTTSAPAEITTAAASRKRRDADDDHNDNGHHEHSRLFISCSPILTSCNYTTQAGSSCLSYQQALRCLPNNLGLLTNCAGPLRYCNNGRCSLFQGSACISSNTSSFPSSSTSSTSLTISASSTSSTTESSTPSA